MLHLLYTAVALGITIAIYADDTTILAAHDNYIEASHIEAFYRNYIQKWLKSELTGQNLYK